MSEEMETRPEPEPEPKNDKSHKPVQWLRLLAAGLAVAAALAATATANGHAADVTAGGPAVCVVLRATP